MADTNDTDLVALARRAMDEEGLFADFPPEVLREAETAAEASHNVAAGPGARDLRGLLWSSIDNEESRDLDQVEYAEELHEGGGVRLLIGVADVDAFAPRGSAVDLHARLNTVSVYTPAVVFHLLPESLSTDATSLLEGADRLALVVELHVGGDGKIWTTDVYPALVRNRAKLVYETVGAWLKGDAPVPPEVARVEGLEGQLRMQARVADSLRALRRERGSLELETIEAQPVLKDGKVVDLAIKVRTPAQDIIEAFMVAANTSMAEFLQARGVPSLRRVVRRPERWRRLADLALDFGERLPRRPDSRALSAFLARRKREAPGDYAELSLAVMKLLGAGDYLVEAPGLDQEGHFGLAVGDYTHSTAPNRRYPDLVTQRCLKAAAAGSPAPYTIEELEEIADRCNDRESASRKVERLTHKAAVAMLLRGRAGEVFDAVVTGVKDRGTFVRLTLPPAEGKLVEGEEGLDVGDRLRVRLLSADPSRGFIDFARVR
ncbi:MAG TPA: RNB domain-containing ribonuclease [Pyrinomonadaceae bacterium]|nr:RNB domain-containing ribonuclease [Pyrinomonadaceae bacterium]